jgi:hypothetical protein
LSMMGWMLLPLQLQKGFPRTIGYSGGSVHNAISIIIGWRCRTAVAAMAILLDCKRGGGEFKVVWMIFILENNSNWSFLFWTHWKAF